MPTKTKQYQTGIRFDDDTKVKVERYAAEKRWTFAQFVRVAVEEYLKQLEQAQARQK